MGGSEPYDIDRKGFHVRYNAGTNKIYDKLHTIHGEMTINLFLRLIKAYSKPSGGEGTEMILILVKLCSSKIHMLKLKFQMCWYLESSLESN